MPRCPYSCRREHAYKDGILDEKTEEAKAAAAERGQTCYPNYQTKRHARTGGTKDI